MYWASGSVVWTPGLATLLVRTSIKQVVGLTGKFIGALVQVDEEVLVMLRRSLNPVALKLLPEVVFQGSAHPSESCRGRAGMRG